jgi:cytochrome P450
MSPPNAAAVARYLGLPLDEYRRLRAEEPITYDDRFKSWNVYRYADALRVLNDPTTFSSKARGGGAMALPSIVGMDGTRHRTLRGLVTQAFTPRMVEQLGPRITAVATELLDAAMARGQFDAIQDFAYPLPIRIISEMLGIPVEDQERFHRWSETLIAGPRTDALRGRSFAEERATTVAELNDYFTAQLDLRRTTPDVDLISRLLNAEVNGDRLSSVEFLEFCRLLLIAGYETTACLIGNGILTLTEMPEVAAELKADASLLAAANEEIVRCFPSVAGTMRIALVDTEIAQQKVAKGEAVIVWTKSANYDESVFVSPETLDIYRSPNRHLGYGIGPHFCLGAPLARLELKIAMGLFLERLSRLQRSSGGQVGPVDSPFLLGVKRLPMSVS